MKENDRKKRRKKTKTPLNLKRGQLLPFLIKTLVSHIIRLMPVIIAVSAVGLQVTDVSTDAVLAHMICSADHCQCVSGLTDEGNWGCITPWDICAAAMVQGTTAPRHCKAASANETACNKESWQLPTTCRCEWFKGDWGCWPTGYPCGNMKVGNTNGREYCKQYNKSARVCEAATTWDTPKNYRSQRYPAECQISTSFIIGPSILSNIMLLISLLHNSNYKKHLKTAGLGNLGEKKFTTDAISLLACLQVLPYIWMILKIIMLVRIYLKKVKENKDSRSLNTLTVQMNIVFSVMEDLPQFYLQMRFFMYSVHGNSYGLVDSTSKLVIVGLLTSCISLCKNYTQYTIVPNAGKISALFTFSTAFITTGARVMLCGLIEYQIRGENVIRLALLVVVCLPLFIRFICESGCRCSRKLISFTLVGFNQKRDSPKSILISVVKISSLSIDIATPSLNQNTTPREPWLNEATATANQNTAPPESCLYEATYTVDRYTIPSELCLDVGTLDKVSPSVSPKATPHVIPIITTPGQSICHNLFNLAGNAGQSIQSLIFTISIDGQSVTGLWPGALFALWALGTKLCYLTKPYLRSNSIVTDTATTALTFCMLSFTINALMVISTGKHRGQCLLITVIFSIYPIYSYTITKSTGEVDNIIRMVYETLGQEFMTPNNQVIDEIITILTPIITMAGLLIFLNILSLLISIVKTRNSSKYTVNI